MPVYTPLQSQAGQRIDVFLAHSGTMSRSALVVLFENGHVTVNGKAVPKSYRISEGDVIRTELPEPEPSQAVGEDIPLDILYEDGDLLVINKPRGLVVHPGAGHKTGTLVNALINHCGSELSGIGGVMRPGIVHRLDKDTPGLMLAAKNDFTHNALCTALQKREITRIYQCVVRGTPKHERGTIEAPIGRHPSKRVCMAVVSNGRFARTHYTVLESGGGRSLVECKLDTGRTHQIRVHMAHIGHPIIGDELYGGGKSKPGGQLLQAVKLSFTHPRTGENMNFQAEPELFL